MMALATRNQAVQTFLFGRADEPFGVGIGIGCPIGCLDDANPRVLQARPHCPTPLRIPVADQPATLIGVSEREVPHDLAHERLVGMWRRAKDLDSWRGHTFYPDAPWALTSISQAQFWAEGGTFRDRYGDGTVGGVLSVDVSEWDVPGTHVRKPAKQCTPAEIREEIWKH